MGKLFSEFNIGKLSIKNRMVMAPVKTAFGKPDGMATKKHVAYYRRRARGGVGMIIQRYKKTRNILERVSCPTG